mmetsp:Transcript_125474/g.360646  ORF Transcript_125474/g.360646 Transcript_125474/m.360646 type:complete len:701 (+) Transcript_125474:74-2176(+)
MAPSRAATGSRSALGAMPTVDPRRIANDVQITLERLAETRKELDELWRPTAFLDAAAAQARSKSATTLAANARSNARVALRQRSREVWDSPSRRSAPSGQPRRACASLGRSLPEKRSQSREKPLANARPQQRSSPSGRQAKPRVQTKPQQVVQRVQMPWLLDPAATHAPEAQTTANQAASTPGGAGGWESLGEQIALQVIQAARSGILEGRPFADSASPLAASSSTLPMEMAADSLAMSPTLAGTAVGATVNNFPEAFYGTAPAIAVPPFVVTGTARSSALLPTGATGTATKAAACDTLSTPSAPSSLAVGVACGSASTASVTSTTSPTGPMPGRPAIGPTRAGIWPVDVAPASVHPHFSQQGALSGTCVAVWETGGTAHGSSMELPLETGVPSVPAPAEHQVSVGSIPARCNVASSGAQHRSVSHDGLQEVQPRTPVHTRPGSSVDSRLPSLSSALGCASRRSVSQQHFPSAPMAATLGAPCSARMMLSRPPPRTCGGMTDPTNSVEQRMPLLPYTPSGSPPLGRSAAAFSLTFVTNSAVAAPNVGPCGACEHRWPLQARPGSPHVSTASAAGSRDGNISRCGSGSLAHVAIQEMVGVLQRAPFLFVAQAADSASAPCAASCPRRIAATSSSPTRRWAPMSPKECVRLSQRFEIKAGGSSTKPASPRTCPGKLKRTDDSDCSGCGLWRPPLKDPLKKSL